MDTPERSRGCLLGIAAGDAVGTTVEFQPRGSFEPLTDMVGGGPFGLRAGQWTDDTSMALCLARASPNGTVSMLMARWNATAGGRMKVT